nr:hypothetical protein [Tanacetum cinerariifolium]
MKDNETKPTTKEFAANDEANYYSGITCIKVNEKNDYELKGKFLDDLHNNAFSRPNGEEAVEHIEYFLRIVDLIDLPNVNQDKLRVLVFPISLVRNAWKWFDEIKRSINSWVDLNAKFLGKYYPPSCTTVNAHEKAPFARWENYGKRPYANDKTKNDYGINLDNNANNASDTQDTKKERHDPSICNIRRFEMVKYSFRDDEEYDLVAKKSTKLVKYQSSGILYIAICLVNVCKAWDDWEVDRYRNANSVILEYMVKINKKACILELKRRNMKKIDSNIQYAVSIKEDTVYMCLHFTKDHEGNKINTLYPEKTNASYSSYENKIFWKISNAVLLQETPNTPY